MCIAAVQAETWSQFIDAASSFASAAVAMHTTEVPTQKPTVFVARDPRRSSGGFSARAIDAARAVGVLFERPLDVLDRGEIPTPRLHWDVMKFNQGCWDNQDSYFSDMAEAVSEFSSTFPSKRLPCACFVLHVSVLGLSYAIGAQPSHWTVPMVSEHVSTVRVFVHLLCDCLILIFW